MRRFLICIHDATPAYAAETQRLIRDLAPLVGRRLAFGVVPDWCGAWPLASHREYCALVQGASEELLLHGYLHRRRRGRGPVSWLAEGSDEMRGLAFEETRDLIERGHRMFIDVFGERARGFLPPAWQRGHARSAHLDALGVKYVLGFSVLDSPDRSISLATWTWDCGRWGWLGHLGHAVGRLSQSVEHRVPSLAIHPRDVARGFWPAILRLTRELLDRGYQPSTPADLLATHDAQAAA